MDDRLRIGSIEKRYDNFKVAGMEEADPINISAIEQINNKTITVILNQDFTEGEKFQVYETNNVAQTVNVTPVEDSINPESNKKVLVADIKFNTGVNYTLKITKDTEVVTEEFIILEEINPLVDAKVDVIGDRILNVKFGLPIQNMDCIDAKGTLTNFYASFYNRDIFNVVKGELDQNFCWLGCIESSKNTTEKETTVRVSGDYKSMEIQFNDESMPIGNHKLMINFSKNIRETRLKDFSDDEIAVPIMEKNMIVSKGKRAARPIKVKAIDRTTLIVKFDNPVLKKDNEKDVINVNGISLNVESVDRVGVNFDVLKYNLNDLAPLPVGKVTVIVGRITDANGYVTSKTTFNDVPVVPIPPIISNVEQYDDTQTKLIITFTKAMKDNDSRGGVKNTSYYTITKLDGTPATIVEPIIYLEDEFKAIVTLEKLEAGTHTLLARDIEDSFGLLMKSQSEEFEIVDATVPKVEGVTFIDKSMIIKFDEKMKVKGEHSVTEIGNYLIDNKTFPPETNATTMKGEKWVRIKLPEKSILPNIPQFNEGASIYIGHSKLKEIKYIENDSGNIYPLCDVAKIEEEVNKIDITNGSVTIVSDNKLQYKYLDKNEFYKINVQDFAVELGDEKILVNPISAKLKDERTIEFNFADNTFNGGISKVFIKTNNEDIKSEDIYGYKVIEEKSTSGYVTNGIKSKIKGVSLVKKNTIRMTFDKSIAHFDLSDFRCVLNNSKIIEMDAFTVVEGTENKVFEVTANIPALIYTDKIEVVLAVPENLIRTLDKDGMKIEIFDSINVETFIAESIKWKTSSQDKGICNNEIIIEFSKEIDAGSLIPNKNFDKGIHEPWAGEEIDIPINKVVFKNGQIMQLDGNESFGEIVLENEKQVDLIKNEDVIKLKLIDGKKIILTFGSNETAKLNKFKLVTYKPYINMKNNTLRNKDNRLFLYSEYNPTAIPSDM